VSFFYPDFLDDMDLESLEKAAANNLEYLDRLTRDYTFRYGKNEYSRDEIIESQRKLLDILKNTGEQKEIKKKIKKNFTVFRAAGRFGKKEVLFTGYFEPVYDARKTPDDEYKFPIYTLPEDLIKIDLSLFKDRYKGESIIARLEENQVLPYYTRMEIENQKILENRNLEIAWLKDPIDVAFLQIQGSGRLKLADEGFIYVGYISSNGRTYKSIGKYLIEKGLMTKEEMSMQGIRKYLSMHPDIVKDILNYNPSYIFFRVLEKGPIGNIGVPLTPGRSIALDSRIFPKGALCFIRSEKPVENGNGEIEKWEKFSRFIFNQDTGGAITGAGRADIFWGSGKYAELAAGHMQHDGELFVLIKKK
jgi:membrane-bound lytic murein transglycosylase A